MGLGLSMIILFLMRDFSNEERLTWGREVGDYGDGVCVFRNVTVGSLFIYTK